MRAHISGIGAAAALLAAATGFASSDAHAVIVSVNDVDYEIDTGAAARPQARLITPVHP